MSAVNRKGRWAASALLAAALTVVALITAPAHVRSVASLSRAETATTAVQLRGLLGAPPVVPRQSRAHRASTIEQSSPQPAILTLTGLAAALLVPLGLLLTTSTHRRSSRGSGLPSVRAPPLPAV
jgi:hypothetical protein